VPSSGGGPLTRLRSYAFLAAIAAVVVVVDRVTKIYVERRFGVGYGPRQIVDHLLFLTVTRNAGAAFGIFQNFTLGFLAVSVVIMIAILIYYWFLPPGDWTARLGLSLVFGGAIANAYDRAVKGSVIDFIQVPHWPVFNVADSSVTVGVVVLLIGTLWANRQPRRR
jgi:signal peptidase II